MKQALMGRDIAHSPAPSARCASEVGRRRPGEPPRLRGEISAHCLAPWQRADPGNARLRTRPASSRPPFALRIGKHPATRPKKSRPYPSNRVLWFETGFH